MEGIKEKRNKSPSFPENAAMLLVDLYIRDEQKYNERLVGGCKKGKNGRQQSIENWAVELSAIGCDRSHEQIANRIKGDIITIRGMFTEEKAERGKTGGKTNKNI